MTVNIDKILEDLGKDFGQRVHRASEAPPVKVIPTGITSLDVATGVGGYPRGTMVEIFGRESAGKTAMTLYSMAEVHRRDGFTALVNLESNITKEGWLDWAVEIAPPWFDPERLVVISPEPGTEALRAFGKLIASGAFDVIVYDSIGAMSTDAELEIGNKKQAYGQSALVTQLVKQAAKFAYDKQCVPIMLNQIRDGDAGNYVVEKAPGGHGKDHFATLRIHLKVSQAEFKKSMGTGAMGKVDGKDEALGFRVNANLVKNKVGAPRRKAGWNYWNYPSPDGILGIDTFQDSVDVALRLGVIEKAGSWYNHEAFPDGRLQGAPKVTEFLRANPQLLEDLRQKMVLKAYQRQGYIMEPEKEVLSDVVA